jgi:hypothetical protein
LNILSGKLDAPSNTSITINMSLNTLSGKFKDGKFTSENSFNTSENGFKTSDNTFKRSEKDYKITKYDIKG